MNTTDIVKDDSFAREAIKNNVGVNYFVEAGAGSGKTTMLVERMISMVKSGIDISKICTITFTKAAANEFYSRFYRKLQDILLCDDLSESERVNVENAIKNIDLCFMGTIDSFCNMLLSEHPIKAGIPSSSSVVSDDYLASVLDSVIARIDRGEFSDKINEKYKIVKNVHRQWKAALYKVFNNVYNNRDAQWVCDSDIICFDDYFAFEKAQLTKIFDSVIKDISVLDAGTKVAAKSKKDIVANKNKLSSFGNRSFNYDVKSCMDILTKCIGMRFPHDYEPIQDYIDFAFKPVKKFYDFCNDDSKNKNIYIARVKSYINYITYSFALDLVGIAETEMRSAGKLTYFDYLYYLRCTLEHDVINNDCRLVRHIRQRHRFFLIDESQDTSPLQTEVFLYLSTENPVANPYECKAEPGTLFIVGDPKQSIYRFRGADIESYKKIKSLFKGDFGEVLYLTRNFRSTRQMCEYFNEVFEYLLNKHELNIGTFSPIPCSENASLESENECVLTYDSKEFSVASIISRIVDNEHVLIRDTKTGKNRPVEYGDIMVIAQRKKDISPILKGIKEYNIPAMVEGFAQFDECNILSVAIAIYKAIVNPTDDYYVYPALINPVFSVPEEEILVHKYEGGKISIFSTANSERTPILSSALEKLLSFCRKCNGLPASAVFSMIEREFDLFEKVGTENLEFWYYAIELIRNAELDGTICSSADCIKFCEGLLEKFGDYERCISLKRNPDCVRIANLHKVKGLEAPVVILDFDKSQDVKTSFSVYTDGEEKKAVGFLAEYLEGKSPITIGKDIIKYADEYDAEIERLEAEKVRLLYVAATRAGSLLIMESSDKSWHSALVDGVDTTDISEIPYNAISENDSIGDTELGSSVVSKLASVLENPAPSKQTYKVALPSKHSHDDDKLVSKLHYDDDETSANETATDGLNAALRGTLVHRLMELLVISKDKEHLEQMIVYILSEHDCTDDRYFDMLKKVGETILCGGFAQKHCPFRDVLAELDSAEEIYTEMPFCYRSDGVIHNGVMDLVYKKNGRWHILDYKTNIDDSNLPQLYSGQMRDYKEALCAMAEIDSQTVDEPVLYHISTI